ncbi:MAG: hypothetical protein A3E82_04560 [Gammaproteobacteria bacterium RIFCSPHIGHO2_12_FULL_38_11]|nr:MAG: hypothetical protein A3E82_04560 [Gammaproteobacteria bacterium RIFCSPHIGHO2_12_FULL_38_11]
MFSEIIDALQVKNCEETPHAQFAVHEILEHRTCTLAVDGIGTITFPFTEKKIEALKKAAQPAKYGLKEKTLLDKTVRDTYEISANQLTVQFNDEALQSILSTMQRKMGLSEHARLTAHLHNLLVYEPGQFFKPHQDSEKLNNMIGTLVIVLPSAHIGGDLIVHHRQDKKILKSENIDFPELQCFAFYSDCQHEIKKVRQGYRVALTYNLVLKNNNDEQHHYQNNKLERALTNYFESSSDDADDAEPIELIYFLDHEYSEHSLRWNILKGNDHDVALAFRQAAKKLNLKAHLTLAEHHESWATDGDDDSPELQELIDDDTALSFWLDDNNQALPYQKHYIELDEVCCIKDMKEFTPFDEEHEGYMGNYGNTVDYWYRRAAIVLWKSEDQIAMNFNLNHEVAFADLLALTTSSGNEKVVCQIISKAKPFLHRSRHSSEEDNFSSYLKLAIYCKNKDLANFLLTPFKITLIKKNILEDFKKLEGTYGADWCVNLLKYWVSQQQKSYYSQHELEHIELLAAQAVRLNIHESIIYFLLSYQHNCFLENDQKETKSTPCNKKQNLTCRKKQAISLLTACFVISSSIDIAQQWITHLLSQNELYSILDIADIYFACEKIPSHFQPIMKTMHQHLKKHISDELAESLRDPNDWTITIPNGCNCEHCKIMKGFVRNKVEREKIWPLSEQYRDHVSSVISQLALPIDISVVKKGSPYRLVLQKTDRLYLDAKEQFEKLTKYMRQL